MISLIVWKLWAFPQRSNFGNFQQFFHHNFWLKWKFWILVVPSERSNSDQLYSKISKIFCIFKNQVLVVKVTFFKIHISKSVDFQTFIYSWTLRIMCYVKVWKYLMQFAHSFFVEDFWIKTYALYPQSKRSQTYARHRAGNCSSTNRLPFLLKF